MDDQVLVDRISLNLLESDGEARCRAGERRSAQAARKLLNSGAEQVGVDVKIEKGENGYIATRK
jgi:hypothetical protein